MSRCESFWITCQRSARKVVEFENVLGAPMKLWLCDECMVAYTDESFRRGLIDRALDSLNAMKNAPAHMRMNVSVQELLALPARRRLEAHQEECARCAAVRDWIVKEGVAGRITTTEDIQRIGAYIVVNSCDVGVELNYQVGLGMKGEQA